MRHIAVLDDDPDFSDYLKQLLSLAGYKVRAYASVGAFVDGVRESPPALIVLDVELPGMNGLDLIRVVRRNQETCRVPIVVVSARRVDTVSIVRGLSEGGDEYFLKPFEAELFVTRVRGLIARSEDASAQEAHEVLAVGGLKVDVTERVVRLNGGKPLTLTRKEFEVLEFFLRNPNRVITKGVLQEEVWREPPQLGSLTVEKHVQSLRRKLGPYGGAIETMVKTGFIFRPERVKR